MRLSKTLILSTNVDQKSLETGFSIAICRPIFRLPCVARQSLEFGYNIFNHIKFSSFIVVLFVLLSLIEALPGGTYSLVLKYWFVSMFHVLFISPFSDNIVPLSLAFSLSLE